MSLKSRAKDLFVSILASKARHYLRASNAKVIIVAGNPLEREIYKQILTDAITSYHQGCVASLPGYNYKLGAVMTVLGFRAGYSSVWRWVQLVFKRSAAKRYDFIILDFSISDDSDAAFVSKYLNPFIVVYTQTADQKMLKNHGSTLTFAPESFFGKEIIRYGRSEKAEIRILSVQEKENNQEVSYSINGKIGPVLLSNFGDHYIYPQLIGKFIINYVQQKT